MSSKELAIKLIVSNQKISNLTRQLVELRKYEAETEFLLLSELDVNDQIEKALRLELVREETYICSNRNAL